VGGRWGDLLALLHAEHTSTTHRLYLGCIRPRCARRAGTAVRPQGAPSARVARRCPRARSTRPPPSAGPGAMPGTRCRHGLCGSRPGLAGTASSPALPN